jgi:hypothetical protein
MTRREWLALVAATPLVKEAAESTAKAASYDDDIVVRLKTLFDQLGGIQKLVKNKTVTVKLNLTGPPTNHVAGRPPQFSHWAHPTVAALPPTSSIARAPNACVSWKAPTTPPFRSRNFSLRPIGT